MKTSSKTTKGTTKVSYVKKVKVKYMLGKNIVIQRKTEIERKTQREKESERERQSATQSTQRGTHTKRTRVGFTVTVISQKLLQREAR